MTDLDVKSNKSRNPDKVLATHKREKKKMYLESSCLEQQLHLSPFVVSTDGLFIKEAKILVLKRLAS
jgi:hypothetical protein